MAMTDAERKAAQREREKEDGFIHYTVKILKERLPELKEVELKLQKKKVSKKK